MIVTIFNIFIIITIFIVFIGETVLNLRWI